MVHKSNSLQLPYFYILPKVHKEMPPQVDLEATRPVVSGVSTVMEPLSKWTDCQLQKVVHLCPAYTMDSWQFLNNLKFTPHRNLFSLFSPNKIYHNFHSTQTRTNSTVINFMIYTMSKTLAILL